MNSIVQDINELDGVYSTVDQEVLKKKRSKKKSSGSEEPPPIPDQNFGATADGSVSHLSLSSSADSNATGSKKASPLRGEKWSHGFGLDDSIMVTPSNGNKKSGGHEAKKVAPAKSKIQDQQPVQGWTQDDDDDDEGITVIDEV